MMIEIDQNLPKRCLIGDPARNLDTVLDENALWLRAKTENIVCDDEGAVIEWRSKRGQATPTKPNTGHTKFVTEQSKSGLRMKAQEHCGFVINDITDTPHIFSMAVIYHAIGPDEPLTLLTLSANSARESNYIFISESSGSMTVKDKRGNLELKQRMSSNIDGLRMLVMSVNNAELAVSRNASAAVRATGKSAQMEGSADLFIGARSHRPGLAKTLGDSIIQDVFFWPKRSLLTSSSQDDQDQFDALCRYYIWS